MKNKMCKFSTYLSIFLLSVTSTFASVKHKKVIFVENSLSKGLELAKGVLNKKNTKQDLIVFGKSIFDLEWNAKMALGRPYKEMSSPQQSEYLKLYEDLIISKWFPYLYNVEKLDSYIVIENVSNITATDDNVKVSFRYKDEGKISSAIVEFRIREYENGELKILNIVAEGIDLALSYRTDFESILSKHNINEFFVKLKEKIKLNENVKK